MKVEKISRIVFPTDEHDYIALEASEKTCAVDSLGIDELVALRDYLQTKVELRVYSKHITQATREVMREEQKPSLKLVGEPLDDCPHDKCFLCFDQEGFKL
jgi:hypothetical protein